MFYFKRALARQENLFIAVLTFSLMVMLFSSSLLAQTNNSVTKVLTLSDVEKLALKDEAGFIAQQWQMDALRDRAVADVQLKDPKLQLALNNIPTDTFDFDQENMTNLKFGLIQQLPVGDSLEIKQQQTFDQVKKLKIQQHERQLMILKDVRMSYLEIIYWEQAKKTIEQNKELFSQLVEVVESQFSVGRNNQQDLIRAQLELSRLEDRLVKIDQKIIAYRAKLSRWIKVESTQRNVKFVLPVLSHKALSGDQNDLSQFLIQHPKIGEYDINLELAKKEIALVKESYKTKWAFNVSYGYRDGRVNGNERADFLSAGVTMDLPFYTEKKQDKKLQYRSKQYEGMKYQRLNQLRKLMSALRVELNNEQQLENRLKLYNQFILPQAKQQTEAALLAYQSDQSDFSDVMRAYIDDLNISLDKHRIAIDVLKAKAKVLYFVPQLTNT